MFAHIRAGFIDNLLYVPTNGGSCGDGTDFSWNATVVYEPAAVIPARRHLLNAPFTAPAQTNGLPHATITLANANISGLYNGGEFVACKTGSLGPYGSLHSFAVVFTGIGARPVRRPARLAPPASSLADCASPAPPTGSITYTDELAAESSSTETTETTSSTSSATTTTTDFSKMGTGTGHVNTARQNKTLHKFDHINEHFGKQAVTFAQHTNAVVGVHNKRTHTTPASHVYNESAFTPTRSPAPRARCAAGPRVLTPRPRCAARRRHLDLVHGDGQYLDHHHRHVRQLRERDADARQPVPAQRGGGEVQEPERPFLCVRRRSEARDLQPVRHPVHSTLRRGREGRRDQVPIHRV